MKTSLETATISAVRTGAYVIPTDQPEADGTYAWTATTLVLVEIDAAGAVGVGYTYTDASAAELIRGTLAGRLLGSNAWDIEWLWQRMWHSVRNLGNAGITANAISAIDCALWDLKAKLLDLPLVRLLGAARAAVPIYGSGGFTTYTDEHLQEQLARWVDEDGCRWVKIKIGTDPERDPARVGAARRSIGNAGLFVDANGAFSVSQALHYAEIFASEGVRWFEEPVSSDDLAGLRRVRDHAPPGMDIAAGEYGYTPYYFGRMLAADAVDVVQADASRCGGITGFMRVAALCDAAHVPLSAHCAPALHLHAAAAAPRLRHQEWFHDHVRIETLLFDGAPRPENGFIAPDLSRPGSGLEFKHKDAQPYALTTEATVRG